ncbi:MAG TPA: hypothetical protein VM925_16320, partial [Labilithrix sp.]|nr:hypothetical protein [Labilithrix sp.]
LDIARALEAKVVSGTPPKPTLTVVVPALNGGDAKLRVNAQDDEPEAGLTARWDLDYDGAFDTGWLPLGEAGEQAIALADAVIGSKIGAKVEVRDTQGNLNGATITLEVGPPEGAAAAPQAQEPAKAEEVGCACRTVGRSRTSERTPASLAVGGALALACLVRMTRRRPRLEERKPS